MKGSTITDNFPVSRRQLRDQAQGFKNEVQPLNRFVNNFIRWNQHKANFI